MTSDIRYVRLGDVLSLPDGRQMTVRSAAAFPYPVGPLTGFVICGELDVLLAVPAYAGAPLRLYVPTTEIPDDVVHGTVLLEGACTFWSPHLPAVRSAMGELTFRVVEVTGSVEPAIVIYRSNEPVLFIPAAEIDPSAVSVTSMPREGEQVDGVERQTAVVLPAEITIDAGELTKSVRHGLYEHVMGARG